MANDQLRSSISTLVAHCLAVAAFTRSRFQFRLRSPVNGAGRPRIELPRDRAPDHNLRRARRRWRFRCRGCRLLSGATFTGGAGSVTGRNAIEQMLRDNVIAYDDGTPRTKHVTTNLAIDVDEDAGTAVSRSYFTVLQAPPDLPLQPIVSGRYFDRFERHNGHWRLVERRVRTDLLGDVSHHLRRSSTDQ